MKTSFGWKFEKNIQSEGAIAGAVHRLFTITVVVLALFQVSCGTQEKKTTQEAVSSESGLSLDDSLEGDDSERVAALTFDRDVLASESLDRSVHDSEPKTTRGKMLLRAGRLCVQGKAQEGLKIIREQARRKGDFKADAWTALGNCYFRQGKTKLAELHYYKALGKDDSYIPAHNNLAVSLIAQGKRAEGFAKLKKVVRMQGRARTPRWNLGRLYLRSYLFGQAENHLSRLASSNSADPDLNMGLAAIYHRMGRFDKALELYEKAEAHKAEEPGQLINFALLLRDKSKWSNMLYVSKRALSRVKSSEQSDSQIEYQKSLAEKLISQAESELQSRKVSSSSPQSAPESAPEKETKNQGSDQKREGGSSSGDLDDLEGLLVE